jgi:hypothetical protein
MIKAGLIAGAVAFVMVVAAGAVVSPFCTPCAGILVGLLAGYLAGVFDKPLNGGAGAKSGAVAGAIAGVLGILGNFTAGVINGLVVNPAAVGALARQFGLTAPSMDQSTIWVSQLTMACCIGLVNLVLMAGLGAAGGALWTSFNKQNPAGMNTPLPPAV